MVISIEVKALCKMVVKYIDAYTCKYILFYQMESCYEI